MDGGPINEKIKKKEKKVTINGYVAISMRRMKKEIWPISMGRTKKEIWSISMGRRE